MRKDFALYLDKFMSQDDKIWLLTGDLGFGLWNNIRDKYPKRFLNTGAAEQALVDIAIGLALQGAIPVVYSITPFLLYRPFESIRTYIDYEHIAVKLVGGGRNRDYEHDGVSHWADDDIKIMSSLNHILLLKPISITSAYVEHFLYNGEPTYLNLKK